MSQRGSQERDIANQMIKIWKEDGLRAQLIEAGKTQRTKYSWDLTAKKLWNSLEKIK